VSWLSFGIGDFLGRQNLDGHEPVQVRISGFVHDAHAAAAERFENLVMQECSSIMTNSSLGTRVKLYSGSEFDGLNARADVTHVRH